MTRLWCFALACGVSIICSAGFAEEDAAPALRYENRLTPIADPRPLLADTPKFLEPIRETRRLEGPTLIDEPGADLEVRAWRFSYNARAIIEIANRIRAASTAVIVVHPWGIDDENGWKSPAPAGVALCCTPEKNRIYNEHVAEVVNPLLKRLRPRVGLVGYSLPNREDAIRKQLYRSVRSTPSDQERAEGARQLAAKLGSFEYRASPIDAVLELAGAPTARAYMQKFPGIDSSAKFNGEGFWQLPIPVASAIEVAPRDVVFYDGEGYPALRDFLKSQGIANVLLCGYNTDMCVCKTTAGYENVSQDFNLFLVGDATLATFPASDTPRYATQVALCTAALTQLVTQMSWIKPIEKVTQAKP